MTATATRFTGDLSVRPWGIGLVLAVATLLVYGPVGTYPFVNYDDWAYVTHNPQVVPGLSWEGLTWAFRSLELSNWHPVAWLSHMLDVQLFGMDAGAHHLSNLGLHLINTLLLFGIFTRATGFVWKSGFVAALFALHPLHVESVAWISERKDLLCTLFFLLSIRWYLGWIERPQLLRYLAVVVFFMIGLMAKPMVVTLPFVLLLLDFWPLGRIGPAGSGKGLAGVVVEKIPLLILSSLSCIMTYHAQNLGGSIGSIDVLPLHLRIGNAVIAYGAYMGKMIWPRNLAVLYPIPEPLPWLTAVLTGLILVALFVLAFRQMGRRPWLTVGWLWYVGMLIPVIGLVQVGSQAMADRYTYLPLVGLFVIVAWGVDDFVPNVFGRRIVLASAAVLAIAGLSILTVRQVGYWQSSSALFAHALKVTRSNPVAHYNMGSALKARGRWAEALVHFRKALALNPDSGAHNNIGVILAGQGWADEAGVHWRQAMALASDDPEAFANYGLMRVRQGRIDEGVAYLVRALAVDPDFGPAHAHLGMAMLRRGDIRGAIASLRKALASPPRDPGAQMALNKALGLHGNIRNAVDRLAKALGTTGGGGGERRAAYQALETAISDYQGAVSRLPGYEAGAFDRQRLPAVVRVQAEYAWKEGRFILNERASSLNPDGVEKQDHGRSDRR